MSWTRLSTMRVRYRPEDHLCPVAPEQCLKSFAREVQTIVGVCLLGPSCNAQMYGMVRATGKGCSLF